MCAPSHRWKWRARDAVQRRSKVIAPRDACSLRVALCAGIVVEFDAVSTSLLHKLEILQGLERLNTMCGHHRVALHAHDHRRARAVQPADRVFEARARRRA